MTPAPQLSLGLLLTTAAGFADVIGFIELGGHYTSFMSGNTTQLGDALSQGIWSTVFITSTLIVLFFCGGFIGSLVALLAGPRWGSASVTGLVLISFAITLALVIAGFPAGQFMLALATGAGAQNAVLSSAGSVRLGTTFVTGTLFTASQDLAKAICRIAPPWRWAQNLLVWASLFLGGVLGAVGYYLAGLVALAIPCLIYLGFFVAFILHKPSSVLK